MALLTPPPAAPQRGDRTTFASRVDAFITWLINFVSELLGLVANLNTLAAGGAYTIPLTLAANPSPIGSNLGLVAPNFSAPSMQGATQIFIDAVDATGLAIKSQLDDVFGSSSASKGYMRLVKQGDPSKWISYRVDAWSYVAGTNPYGLLSVTCVGASSVNPFNVGDALIMKCQRTGDKGDAGPPASLPSIYVRYEVAAGTSAETLTSASWNPRSFNTVKWNDAPASLASYAPNTISLAAGTWEIEASGAAHVVGAHKVRLYNVIDAVVAEVGEAAYAGSSSGTSTRSHVRTRVTVPIGTTKTYRLDHWTASGGVAQPAAGGAAIEVYSELKATKVA